MYSEFCIKCALKPLSNGVWLYAEKMVLKNSFKYELHYFANSMKYSFLTFTIHLINGSCPIIWIFNRHFSVLLSYSLMLLLVILTQLTTCSVKTKLRIHFRSKMWDGRITSTKIRSTGMRKKHRPTPGSNIIYDFIFFILNYFIR